MHSVLLVQAEVVEHLGPVVQVAHLVAVVHLVLPEQVVAVEHRVLLEQVEVVEHLGPVVQVAHLVAVERPEQLEVAVQAETLSLHRGH
jgi:predicted MarR family transcription regulator